MSDCVLRQLQDGVCREIDEMVDAAREAIENDCHPGCTLKKRWPHLTWVNAAEICRIASGEGDESRLFWEEAIRVCAKMDGDAA
ncbi:hypothetical protein [Jiella sonneratiae]|uniref:Uncharacterized protein n=1 Tax=Jiella sonneratiae TaxID=2816856 RepID=A0ABS3J9H6_9HYPH|nr:hypothetical protein [Jiella sonneratiae]MBO0905573.1 hypothetical protein [Jiella sonneratiae]